MTTYKPVRVENRDQVKISLFSELTIPGLKSRLRAVTCVTLCKLLHLSDPLLSSLVKYGRSSMPMYVNQTVAIISSRFLTVRTLSVHDLNLGSLGELPL